MHCSEALSSIVQDLTGDAPAADAALAAHLVSCPDCRAQRETFARVWTALDDGATPAITPLFAAATLDQMRVRISSRARAPSRRGLGTRAAGWAVAAAAGFVVAIIIVAHRPAPERIRQPETVAASVAAPDVRPPAPMPEALRALASNALSSDGGRLRALALAPDYFAQHQIRPSAVLIDALTRTLRTDRNPGVRLKAAEALASLGPLPEVRDAFILALRADPNPAVRIIAVDALARAARTLDPASIESLRERASDPDESQHMRTVAARALGTLSL